MTRTLRAGARGLRPGRRVRPAHSAAHANRGDVLRELGASPSRSRPTTAPSRSTRATSGPERPRAIAHPSIPGALRERSRPTTSEQARPAERPDPPQRERCSATTSAGPRGGSRRSTARSSSTRRTPGPSTTAASRSPQSSMPNGRRSWRAVWTQCSRGRRSHRTRWSDRVGPDASTRKARHADPRGCMRRRSTTSHAAEDLAQSHRYNAACSAALAAAAGGADAAGGAVGARVAARRSRGAREGGTGLAGHARAPERGCRFRECPRRSATCRNRSATRAWPLGRRHLALATPGRAKYRAPGTPESCASGVLAERRCHDDRGTSPKSSTSI